MRFYRELAGKEREFLDFLSWNNAGRSLPWLIWTGKNTPDTQLILFVKMYSSQPPLGVLHIPFCNTQRMLIHLHWMPFIRILQLGLEPLIPRTIRLYVFLLLIMKFFCHPKYILKPI